MAGFDIIDAANHGYRQVWQERHYLARLALVPVVVHFVVAVLIDGMGLQENFLRRAVFMLPVFLTQGWMLSHMVRLNFFGQRWPFMPTGDHVADERVLRDRFRGVMAGTIVFALVSYLGFGVLQYMTGLRDEWAPDPQSGEPVNMGVLFAALMLLFSAVWAVRLLWLFVPAALNYPVRRFMVALGSFSTSLYILGLWMVTSVPLTFLFAYIVGALFSGAGQAGGALIFVVTILQVIVGTITALISTSAMCHAFREMYKRLGAA